jgi:hypothetical protein
LKKITATVLLGLVWTTGVAHADLILLGQQQRLIFTKELQMKVNWFNFGTHKTINDCNFEMKQVIVRMKYYVRESKIIGETDSSVTLNFIGKDDGLEYMDSNYLYCIPWVSTQSGTVCRRSRTLKS